MIDRTKNHLVGTLLDEPISASEIRHAKWVRQIDHRHKDAEILEVMLRVDGSTNSWRRWRVKPSASPPRPVGISERDLSGKDRALSTPARSSANQQATRRIER
jgi:hypothetical protein